MLNQKRHIVPKTQARDVNHLILRRNAQAADIMFVCLIHRYRQDLGFGHLMIVFAIFRKAF